MLRRLFVTLPHRYSLVTAKIVMKRKAGDSVASSSSSADSHGEPPAKKDKKDPVQTTGVPNLAGTTALKLEITARWNKARVGALPAAFARNLSRCARCNCTGKLTLPHGVVDTPVFMCAHSAVFVTEPTVFAGLSERRAQSRD